MPAGGIPDHIIMDENHADFLIVGGGIAGNLLANRIHNALGCLSMDVNFGQWLNDRKISNHFLEFGTILLYTVIY